MVPPGVRSEAVGVVGSKQLLEGLVVRPAGLVPQRAGRVLLQQVVVPKLNRLYEVAIFNKQYAGYISYQLCKKSHTFIFISNIILLSIVIILP